MDKKSYRRNAWKQNQLGKNGKSRVAMEPLNHLKDIFLHHFGTLHSYLNTSLLYTSLACI